MEWGVDANVKKGGRFQLTENPVAGKVINSSVTWHGISDQ